MPTTSSSDLLRPVQVPMVCTLSLIKRPITLSAIWARRFSTGVTHVGEKPRVASPERVRGARQARRRASPDRPGAARGAWRPLGLARGGAIEGRGEGLTRPRCASWNSCVTQRSQHPVSRGGSAVHTHFALPCAPPRRPSHRSTCCFSRVHDSLRCHKIGRRRTLCLVPQRGGRARLVSGRVFYPTPKAVGCTPISVRTPRRGPPLPPPAPPVRLARLPSPSSRVRVPPCFDRIIPHAEPLPE